MEPTVHRPYWEVSTCSELADAAVFTPARWKWAAYGLRGAQAGVEESADAAIGKARAAAFLLDDPRRTA